MNLQHCDEESLNHGKMAELSLTPLEHQSCSQVTKAVSNSPRLCSCFKEQLDEIDNNNSQGTWCASCEVHTRQMCVTSPTTLIVSEEVCCDNPKELQVVGAENNGLSGEVTERMQNEEPCPVSLGIRFENKHCDEHQSSVQSISSGILETKNTEALLWTDDGPPPHWADKDGAMVLLSAHVRKRGRTVTDNTPCQIPNHTLPRKMHPAQNVFGNFRRREGRVSRSSQAKNDDNSLLEEGLSEDNHYSNEWRIPRKATILATERALAKVAKSAISRLRRRSETELYVSNNENNHTFQKAVSSFQGKRLDESKVLRKAISWMRGTEIVRASGTFITMEDEETVMFEDSGVNVLFEYDSHHSKTIVNENQSF